MMSSKKKKNKRLSFRPGALKKKQGGPWIGPGLKSILKVLAIACVLGGIAMGLALLERYVKRTAPMPQGAGKISLAPAPPWVNEQLQQKLRDAATANAADLRLDENAAASARRNIRKRMAWIDNVKVQTTGEGLLVEGSWRKPVAMIKSGPAKFYVDSESVLLDFVPMPNLPIVEITGLSMATKMPPLGEAWGCEDLAAAITIIDRLTQMDRALVPDKPMLYEIDRINVSNFNGRQNKHRPHIVLYSRDNTEIMWGAEVGQWQRHLESTDEQKLAKLYSYYKEFGTLSGGVKYINLRDPRDKIPLPIDKY